MAVFGVVVLVFIGVVAAIMLYGAIDDRRHASALRGRGFEHQSSTDQLPARVPAAIEGRRAHGERTACRHVVRAPDGAVTFRYQVHERDLVNDATVTRTWQVTAVPTSAGSPLAISWSDGDVTIPDGDIGQDALDSITEAIGARPASTPDVGHIAVDGRRTVIAVRNSVPLARIEDHVDWARRLAHDLDPT